MNMSPLQEILTAIERLRSTMYQLADEGKHYSEVLAVSQELDTLIVEFQKSTYCGFFNAPPPIRPVLERGY